MFVVTITRSAYQSIHAIFHGNVVEHENAYQILDNQPPTHMPCCAFEQTAPHKGGPACDPPSVPRHARSWARAISDRDSMDYLSACWKLFRDQKSVQVEWSCISQ